MFARKAPPRKAEAPTKARFGFAEKENTAPDLPVPVASTGGSPELRKRLVDVRAQSRLVEQKQAKALQDMKVQNLIQSAIQEKENEFLRQENAKLNAKVEGSHKRLKQREFLIGNLKERIAVMARAPTRGRLGRRPDESMRFDSSCMSMMSMHSLDESRIEDRRSLSREPEREPGESGNGVSRSPSGEERPRETVPVPTQVTPARGAELGRSVAFDSAATLQTYVVPPPTQRRSWTAPARSPQAVESSPESSRVGDTPMSDMSVEKHVDRVNERLHALLQTGSEALHPPEVETPLDETMRTERTEVSELHSVMIPLNDTLFERTELIPFLERTSEDLRDAEAAVRGLDQDLEALSDATIADEVNTLKSDNNALRSQLEELMDRMLAGADAVQQYLPAGSQTARGPSSTAESEDLARARSMSPAARPPHFPTVRAPSQSRLTVRSPRSVTTSGQHSVQPPRSGHTSVQPPLQGHQSVQPPPPPQSMIRRGANGTMYLKVEETRTERWIQLPRDRAPPMLSHVPQVTQVIPPAR